MNCTGGQFYNDSATYNILPTQHAKCSLDNSSSNLISQSRSDNFLITSYSNQQQENPLTTQPTNSNIVKGGDYLFSENLGPRNFTSNQCSPTNGVLPPQNTKQFQSPIHYPGSASFTNYDHHPVSINMPPPPLTVLRRGNSANSSPIYSACPTPTAPMFPAPTPTHDTCYQRFYPCYSNNSRYAAPPNCAGSGFNMYNCNQEYCPVINQPSYSYNGLNPRDDSKHTNGSHVGIYGQCLSEDSSPSVNNFTELIITNLDYNIGPKEWKKILYTQLQGALKVYMQTQADGSSCAVVRVGSIDDARLAISQFHRKKIGYKRIQVNIVSPENSWNAQTVKHEVVALLKSVSGRALSVCKFMELFEKRYHRSVSISELYKLKDVVEIKDYGGNQNGRIIFLLSNSSGGLSQNVDTSETDNLLESTVCVIHCQEGSKEYIDAMDSCLLPNVEIRLKTFKHQVHKLIQMHNGSMPLMSFPACYKAEFGELIVSRNQGNTGGDPLQMTVGAGSTASVCSGGGGGVGENSVVGGVPLEHLITCVTGVHITVSTVGVKKIQWEEKRDETRLHPSQVRTDSSSGPTWTSPPQLQLPPCTGPVGPGGGGPPNPPAPCGTLADQLHQLSREVVDLIKHQPGCRILLSRFIPTYHHHFGKQCRVADYGYSKLHELIEALPHVVHLMGSGNLRTLTLAHRVQLRRFTNELTKILKAQPSKACRACDLPTTYQRIFKRDFHVTDYGVCYLEDLLDEIPENTVEVSMDPELVVSVPRRLQTPEEREKTAQFALEVVDLLQQSPRCRLPFNKFIPSYHHHFSRQCKVADYGFGKLVELLEAVPHVAHILEEHDEKYVCLTRREQVRVLAEQTLSLLEGSPNKRIALRDFINIYMKHQGYALNLDDFNVRSVRHLMEKIPRIAQVEATQSSDSSSSGGLQLEEYVCLADRTHIKHLAHKLLLLLLDQSCGVVAEDQFVSQYQCSYREPPNIIQITQELGEIIRMVEDPSSPGNYLLELRPLIMLARDLRQLLRDNQGRLQMLQLEASYERQFGLPLRPQAYGYPSLMTLLQAVNYVASVRGRGARATILLCHDFLGKLAYRVAYSTEPIDDTNCPTEQHITPDPSTFTIITTGDHHLPPNNSLTYTSSPSPLEFNASSPSNTAETAVAAYFTSPPAAPSYHHHRHHSAFYTGFTGEVGYADGGAGGSQQQNELDELVEQLALDASIVGVSNTPSPSSGMNGLPPPGFYLHQWSTGYNSGFQASPSASLVDDQQAISSGHLVDTTMVVDSLKDIPESVGKTSNSRLVGNFDCLRSN